MAFKSVQEQVKYRRSGQHSNLAEMEYELKMLQDELDKLKEHKAELEEKTNIRRNLCKHLDLHKYGAGIVIKRIQGKEVLFQFNVMLVNEYIKGYCMWIADLGNGAFSVKKYHFPHCVDICLLLKKPEFKDSMFKFVNHVHSCLIAYHDRKHQVMQAEANLNNMNIKIANTIDYRLLEITINVKINENKQFMWIIVVLKYEGNEVRPRTINVEDKDSNKEVLEDIKVQFQPLQVYSLEDGLRIALMKDESSALNNVSDIESIDSMSTVKLSSTVLKQQKIVRKGRGRINVQQKSSLSESEESEEVDDLSDWNHNELRRKKGKMNSRGLARKGHGKERGRVSENEKSPEKANWSQYNQRKRRGRGPARGGRGRGGTSLQQESSRSEDEKSQEEIDWSQNRLRGRGARSDAVKQSSGEIANKEHNIRGRGRGRGSRRGSKKMQTKVISSYFEHSKSSK